ncbi:glutamate synthase subunit beta [Chitinispirillales bacterium ANBcel5]|uniref:glutamate synthase subunit beta n=1 Tax=Cellulosispirillum alkaliphilum TaxID=3039283 RepID=UPI002A5361E2|nr:glutamate synthase subunit beta [Chitinispirillales bacterium ANBcel5]
MNNQNVLQRKKPEYRKASQCINDWLAVELFLTSDQITDQARICMDCGVPFCHGYGCTLGNVIPEFNELVAMGRWAEAWNILTLTNPFPEFTARICPALCEGSCVAGINEEPVNIRQIEYNIVEQAFQTGLAKPALPSHRKQENVAVVGSGPAGLAVAWKLNQKGYTVTVFESAEKPGGLLRYGIPDFKLEKWVIDRRIKLMQEEGITFKTSVTIGSDISSSYLHRTFDAVVLAGGARTPRQLNVPGGDLNGVHYALPYLTLQNRINGGENVSDQTLISAKDKSVVVIGGGDTGSDCLGTALRQGAKKVVQIEIMPKPPLVRSSETPWPEWPYKLRESSSHKEGGERKWSVMTKKIVGNEGKVSEVRCCEVKWGKDENGGKNPIEIPGSEFTLKAELVLIAMGFTGPGCVSSAEEFRLERSNNGFIWSSEEGVTSHEGVFATGDITKGPSLVVKAIADGLDCADTVEKFIRKKNNA